MEFKNYEDYTTKRTGLLNQAQEMLNKGEMGEEYQNLKNSVTDLDEKFKQFSTEQANLNALNNTQKPSIELCNIRNNNTKFNTDDEDLYNSNEYRKSFMNYVTKGATIPKEFLNANEVTKTTDIGVAIPTTILQKIIEKIQIVGNILNLVTRTSYKGGVGIPTSSVKPVATWVSEGSGSETQKKKMGQITFEYYKLRCAVAVSLETNVMSMTAFETSFINNVSEAMIYALEQAIVNGDGNGKPKGILAEEVKDDKKVEIKAGESIDYNTLINAESCLELAYESKAVWFMHKTTFMAFIGMVDSNGQPIARVNYGIAGVPERILLGRKVILNEYMTSIKATITKDEVIAFLFNPSDYVLNTNLNLTIKKYEDNETDDIITKAIMLVDGKVVDTNSLVTVVKKS